MNYKQLLIQELQDLHAAESEQAHQFPQLLRLLENEGLRSAFEEHLNETQTQLLRLRQMLEMAGTTAGMGGRLTPGLQGLMSEAHKKLEEVRTPALRDLAAIAILQKLEHYEIACYGTARAMARTAGLDEAGRLLQATLEEEQAADKRLTDVALPLHKQAAEQDATIEH